MSFQMNIGISFQNILVKTNEFVGMAYAVYFFYGGVCTILWGYRIMQISNTQITLGKVVF